MRDSLTASTLGAVFALPQGPRQLCLIVQYDGTDYHGFVKQKKGPTIQGVLESVLVEVMGKGRVVGASRTDSGVHAQGQVVVWDGQIPMPVDRVARALNGRLPKDIQIRGAGFVPLGWDPRRQATAKQYSYRIWRDALPPDLPWYRMVHVFRGPLVWSKLVEGAALFVGTHDFQAFRTEGSGVKTTVRTIRSSGWSMEEDGRLWRYQVVGDGFLYRMVRHMVGGMLQAAGAHGSLDVLKAGLSNPGCKVSWLAPAEGLTLDWINFG